ncbi:MAG TPA: tetratricopeptide repeat protein [Vitreimonas sp.]|uniref:tetratricopeptide repeat protein n=1 Tax=Vitreimonas sp. TaxID=3069702 RepID=UPI002D6F39CB|nr:tetratricopeptide repeat protein [Vitreimonas sp.]HYD89353.1 tetratricopeptide repeat protein [Vitreimonas sp.]
MTMSVRLTTAAAVVALGFAGAALAAPGGGGGAGPAPSVSPREDPQAAYQAGVAALNAQNYREAIRQFRSARRALPDSGAINYALGVAYNGAGETDDARESFERAARADDAPAATRLQLGLIHIAQGNRDEAVAQQTALAQMISACDGACGDARRAQLQAAHDQLTRALAAPADAPQADPAVTGWIFPNVEEGRAAYAEAVGLINAERFPEALDALARTQAAIGPSADVLNYMGFASRKLGRLDEALGYYREALRLDPAHLGATEYLGELYIQMGELDRARTQLARLDDLCTYGCAQREELARWIERAE